METIGAGALFEKLGDAQLGVGGRALSGGEQKQMAIARALATKKPVLLLDEPTSGLDDRAQAAVLAAIERLRGKRTVILVTHRRSRCAIADQVITFEAVSVRRQKNEPRTCAHGDFARGVDVAVEDVGVALVESHARPRARGVDVIAAAETFAEEHERHLRAEQRRAERARDEVDAFGIFACAIERRACAGRDRARRSTPSGCSRARAAGRRRFGSRTGRA